MSARDRILDAAAKALREADRGSLIGMTEGDARIYARAVLEAAKAAGRDEAQSHLDVTINDGFTMAVALMSVAFLCFLGFLAWLAS